MGTQLSPRGIYSNIHVHCLKALWSSAQGNYTLLPQKENERFKSLKYCPPIGKR